MRTGSSSLARGLSASDKRHECTSPVPDCQRISPKQADRSIKRGSMDTYKGLTVVPGRAMMPQSVVCMKTIVRR